MSNRSDDFNRADSTTSVGSPSDGGSGWTVDRGTWGISTNRVYKNLSGSGSGVPAITLDCGSDAVTVAVTISVVGVAAVCVRVLDENDLIYGNWDNAGNFKLWKLVAGSPTQIGSTSAGNTVSAGDVLSLTVDASGNLTFKQSGTSKITGTDTTGAGRTRHGLANFASGTRADDFSITDLASGSTITADLTESAAVSESAASAVAASAALAEPATAADAVTSALQAAAVLAEPVTAADAVASALQAAAAVAEAVAAAEASSTGPLVTAAITETAAAADAIEAAAQLVAAVLEAATVADAITAAGQWVVLITEPAAAADAQSASAPATHAVSVAELVAALDAITADAPGALTLIRSPAALAVRSSPAQRALAVAAPRRTLGQHLTTP